MTYASLSPDCEYSSSITDYIRLLKPGVMSLVVFTGLAGMVVAPGSINLFQYILTLLSIALGSGAGAAINMWYDRDIDAIMARTSARPVPAGRVAADDALALGLFLAALAVMIIGLAVNWVASFILAFAIFFYAVIYTMWLKRRTPQNIVIGGAAGAFPPMIGYAAVSGDVSLLAFILFSIIFLWTPPHFWALALFRSGDYAKAGIPMLPVVAGARNTKLQMLVYTIALFAVTLFPSLLSLAGNLYAAAAFTLGIVFLYHIIRVIFDSGDKWAKKTFGFSIFYLFFLFTALMVDSWLIQV